MIYLIVVVVFSILIGSFLYFGNKPKIHKNISQDDLVKYLEVLLFRGYNKGFIIIRLPKDKKFKRFLQFRKYIEDKKKVGLQFAYPLSSWSKPYYEKLKAILKERKIKFEIEKTECEEVPEFIIIDLKKDLAMAVLLSRLIINQLYGLKSNDCVELYFENVSEEEEKIGF
jgi:hypothetical protein